MFLSILNVGRGDTKLNFNTEDPEECKRAQRILRDMLTLGYVIAVRDGEKWVRVRKFDVAHNEYLISESPLSRKPRRGRRQTRRLPAATTRAIAVARSAGGMSMQLDSVEVQNLRAHDGLAGLRSGLAFVAGEKGEWAGIPMPLEGSRLVVEPKYRLATCFEVTTGREAPAIAIRNRFYASRYQRDVIIWDEPNGRVGWTVEPINRAGLELMTLGNSSAWGIEQEAAALQLLGELVTHAQMKSYLLTGSFIETSKRSGVAYVFRKLRPTVAIRADEDGSRVLAALCMHPIAYYEGSWAGAMCPTDDVIAHLTLMRADEPLYWGRCNQHAAYRLEAGL